ncbi:zinc finger protein 177 [Drosophila virilis]|uniref:C2H2-type domain-containing protein n=1 Tax=Drosophila virilis TaxID=7244 RepID=B4M601_DROVI|nr:zinc finger protein 808 [Drosophila virilis]EDW59077.1 uncharacterized protein Dvir_GJ10674 [Drosophila virilis]
MQHIQAKVTPIVVPVYELPEYVCVETCCITQQFAKEHNITGISKISKNIAALCAFDNYKPAPKEQLTMPTTESVKQDNSVPCRMREIQTENISTADVGIQCKRDDDDDEAWIEPQPSTGPDEESMKQERKFLSYVSQHTSMFPNGMLECLICGEVANYLLEHQRHMAMHYGPRALCFSCGKLIKHRHLIGQHGYSCTARPHARSRPQIHMQCPHLHCSFMVVSKQQLRRHLKRHLNVKAHHCLLCRKSFSSFAQFLVHRMLVSACSRAKHIYLDKCARRAHVKAQIYRCTICLKRFNNAFRCVLHKRRCILQHHKRLRWLLTQ